MKNLTVDDFSRLKGVTDFASLGYRTGLDWINDSADASELRNIRNAAWLFEKAKDIEYPSDFRQLENIITDAKYYVEASWRDRLKALCKDYGKEFVTGFMLSSVYVLHANAPIQKHA